MCRMQIAEKFCVELWNWVGSKEWTFPLLSHCRSTPTCDFDIAAMGCLPQILCVIRQWDGDVNEEGAAPETGART